MGPFILYYALNDKPILLIIYSVPLRADGPFVYYHGLNDGPMPLMIYCVTIRVYGPIHINLRAERWAHTLNYIFCSAHSVWARLYFVTL
jgi:hypothetical protein